MKNRQQLVIILEKKEDMALLTYGIFYKGKLTCRKLLVRYFRRYTMNGFKGVYTAINFQKETICNGSTYQLSF